MKIVNATPLSEVNGVKFGMKREEVRSVFGTATEFKKSKFSKTATDDFGFCHVYYNINDECEAIELFDECEVVMNGKVIFPYDDVTLRAMLTDIEEDDSGFISRKLSIGVFSPDNKMESILFGCEGYYD